MKHDSVFTSKCLLWRQPIWAFVVMVSVLWGWSAYGQEDLSPSPADLESIQDSEYVVYRIAFLPYPEEYGAMETVYQAIELDLALNENLIMIPSDDLVEQLGDQSGQTQPESLYILSEERQIDAVIRSRPSLNGPIIQIHRTSDQGIVFAKLLNVPLSKKQTADLYREIYLAIAELEDLPALSLNALAVLESQAAPEPKEPEPATKPAMPDAAPAEEDGSTNQTAVDTEEPKPSATMDRLGRLVLSYSPVFYSYQACEPVVGSLPFTCQAEDDGFISGATVYPWSGFIGGSSSLEIYPWIPYLGLMMDASIFQSQLAFSKDLYQVPSIGILGGHMQVAAMARGVFSLGFLSLGIGVRLGYQLLYAFVDEHYIVADDESYEVTLLPSYLVHSSLVGVAATAQLSKWIRAHLDVDILPAALTIETPTTIGASPLSVGMSSQLKIDFDLFWGFILSSYLKGTVINTDTTGEGTRITRELDTFHSGRSVIFHTSAGVGVGFHF